MSDPLAQLSAHVADLITGYAVRFHRWTDADQNGAGKLVLFRLSSTGDSDFLVSRRDVLIRMLCNPAQVEAGRVVMQRIQARIFTEYKGQGAFHFQPMGEVLGPMYLQNDRAMFDLNVRVMSDQVPDSPNPWSQEFSQEFG
jgi:hypothetical protein